MESVHFFFVPQYFSFFVILGLVLEFQISEQFFVEVKFIQVSI